MMNHDMMWGMGVFGLIGAVIVILVIAALIKYGRYVTLTRMSQEVVIVGSESAVVIAARGNLRVPRVIADAGDQAARRFLEFFAATIRNKNTRLAYYHATGAVLRLVRSSQDR